MVEPSFLHPGAFGQPMTREVRVGETIKSAPDNGPKTFEIAFKFQCPYGHTIILFILYREMG